MSLDFFIHSFWLTISLSSCSENVHHVNRWCINSPYKLSQSCISNRDRSPFLSCITNRKITERYCLLRKDFIQRKKILSELSKNLKIADTWQKIWEINDMRYLLLFFYNRVYETFENQEKILQWRQPRQPV